jgi:hypothetical protein
MGKKQTKTGSSREEQPDLRDQLKIDEMRLIEEWVKQPLLVFDAIDGLGAARRRLDGLKDQLAATQASLSQQIRANPEEYGIEKVTEKAIENVLQTAPELEELQTEMRDARHLVDMYSALSTALEHKKKALENLVTLQNQAWHADPKATAAVKETFEQERIQQARHPKRKP